MNWELARETGVANYMVRRLLWRMHKLRPATHWEFVLPNGSCVRLFPRSFFSADIYCTRGYIDWGAEQLLLRYLGECQRGGVCYDVGANMGYYSVLMASVARSVFAFEPDARNHAMLSAQRAPGVTLVPRAVGSKCGMVSFALGDESSVSHLGDDVGESGESVECVTLDAFRAGRPDSEVVEAVKMDIEGFEIEALNSAEALAENDQPVFLIEFNIESGRPNSFAALDEFLSRHRYRLFSMIRVDCGGSRHTTLRMIAASDLSQLNFKMLFLVPPRDKWFERTAGAGFCFEDIRR